MSRGANTVRSRDSNAPAPNTSFAKQLRETLNSVPTHAWYATPSGTLIFVNEKAADYGGLPKDHPLRLGIDTGGPWDAHVQFCIQTITMKRAGSGQTVSERNPPVK
jgi:PAS domain-containing protein